MNEDVAVLLFFFGISLTANVALLVGVLRSAMRIRRLERAALPVARSDDEHVERLEQAMDALTSQVDQLTSNQEFLNRLVTERLEKMIRDPRMHEGREGP